MIDYVAVPKGFLKLHKFVTVLAYVMFLNVAPLLITIKHGINYVTAKHIPTHMAKQLSKSLKRLMKICSRSSMTIQTVLMVMEFDNTINSIIINAVMNTSSAK